MSDMVLHLPPLGEFTGEVRVTIRDLSTGELREFAETIGPSKLKLTSEPGYWLTVPEVFPKKGPINV